MTDYISRQAAIEALAGWKISPIVLNPVPTADVRENVRGEWIKPIYRGDVLSYGKAYYECDQCHKVAFFGNEMNFCPNCGADMRGGDAE